MEETTSIALLTFMVVGTTELIRRLFKRDYMASAIITASAVVGGFGGAVLLPDVGLVLGIVVGLGASGVVTGVQKFGAGTTVSRTSITRDQE